MYNTTQTSLVFASTAFSSVEDLLQRRCDADVSGDVSHAFMLSTGPGLTWLSFQSRHRHFPLGANVAFCDGCAFLSADRSPYGDGVRGAPLSERAQRRALADRLKKHDGVRRHQRR